MTESKVKGFLIPLVLLIVLGACSVLILFGELFHTHSGNEQNRKALVELQGQLNLGDSYESVLTKYWRSAENTQLRIRPENEKCWIVSMPIEVLETDWRMFLGFDGGRVSGIMIRTSDGPKDPNSPPDVGEKACGF